jgi:hypothetical protein
MIWIWESNFGSYNRVKFKKLFMPKEQIWEPVPLKRFPRKEIVQIEIGKHRPVEDFYSCGLLDIVSERLADLLLEQKAKIQLYPVTVTHAGGKEIEENFYYPHLLNEVDCVDWEQSDIITTPTGTNRGKLVLDESKAEGEKLFYIKGLNHTRAISEDLKKLLVAGKFKGLILTRPAEYLKPQLPNEKSE